MPETVEARNTLCKSKPKGCVSRTPTRSHATLEGNKASRRDALHAHFPSSFFIAPKVLFYCPLLSCLHSIVTEEEQTPVLCGQKPQPGLRRAGPARPSSVHQRDPAALFDITLLWLSGPLCCCCLRQIEEPLCASVLSWEQGTGGTCWAATGEPGMRR